jgi:molybdopterin molybdotransferase
MTQELISPEAAWQLLEPHLQPLPGTLMTRRRSWRRVLARDLQAQVDVPGLDVSAMDGYAIGSETLPGRLPVIATIAAGDRPGLRLEAAAAARIMTGAPVPTGADRVVPLELTDRGEHQVALHEVTRAGAHIRRRGEVIRQGDPLLSAGSLVTATAIATLATHGISALEVHRPPSVAVVTTGNEVVPPSVMPGPGQLRDSHTDFLLAAGRGLALEFDSLGIAADDPDALAERISSGMRFDVLILCGGVSKGAFDWVEGTLERCGCEILFHNIAIQPGKPLLAARHPGGLVFGLPGNPNAVMVTFALFVRPSLRRLMGQHDGFWQGARSGVLAGPIGGAGARDLFVPAALTTTSTDDHLRPIAALGSHDVNAFSQAQALVRVPAGSAPRAAGEPCAWLPLDP